MYPAKAKFSLARRILADFHLTTKEFLISRDGDVFSDFVVLKLVWHEGKTVVDIRMNSGSSVSTGRYGFKAEVFVNSKLILESSHSMKRATTTRAWDRLAGLLGSMDPLPEEGRIIAEFAGGFLAPGNDYEASQCREDLLFATPVF